MKLHGKCITGGAFGLLLLSSSLFLGPLFFHRALLFESLESKTKTGGPVYNRISFTQGKNEDVWKMKQSHNGLTKDLSEWDNLAIVVNKTKKPYEAKFYQLPKGVSDSTTPLVATPYKARCFACHPNGPRAIRSNQKSHLARMTFFDRLQTFALNLRIKTYGRVKSVPAEKFPYGSPFRANSQIFSQPLELKSCRKCHDHSGVRNVLLNEHIGTAYFLVNRGLMPPFPFSISEEDRQRLNEWTKSRNDLRRPTAD